jgi:uncharacterized protein YndB with AHSA1/START domain
LSNLIELSITVKAGTVEVWHALTDPDELENWWGESVTLQPKVGGAFKEKWEDDEGNKQLASGKVIAMKNKKSITFTWAEKDWPKGAVTECTFEISEAGPGKSTLTVRHSGWETLPESRRAKTLKDFKTGWSFHLKELKEYLDFLK